MNNEVGARRTRLSHSPGSTHSSMTSRRRFMRRDSQRHNAMVTALATALTLMLVAACGSSGGNKATGATTATSAAGPKVGGHITYASGEVPSLDPLKLGEGSTGNDRGIQVYETL